MRCSDRLADAVIDYLNAQIDAGAQAVQIFDSWGGALAHREYIRIFIKLHAKNCCRFTT